jgi:hypothetical protein
MGGLRSRVDGVGFAVQSLGVYGSGFRVWVQDVMC